MRGGGGTSDVANDSLIGELAVRSQSEREIIRRIGNELKNGEDPGMGEGIRESGSLECSCERVKDRKVTELDFVLPCRKLEDATMRGYRSIRGLLTSSDRKFAGNAAMANEPDDHGFVAFILSRL